VKRLIDVLVSLSIEGEGYSSIHPAFCFIIACMCIKRPEDFATLNNIMSEIGSGNKSVRVHDLTNKPYLTNIECSRCMHGFSVDIAREIKFTRPELIGNPSSNASFTNERKTNMHYLR
jgi:hypothetical protein